MSVNPDFIRTRQEVRRMQKAHRAKKWKQYLKDRSSLEERLARWETLHTKMVTKTAMEQVAGYIEKVKSQLANLKFE